MPYIALILETGRKNLESLEVPPPDPRDVLTCIVTKLSKREIFGLRLKYYRPHRVTIANVSCLYFCAQWRSSGQVEARFSG